ncbi:permease [Brevibacillus massiliensis]|uniref:permease n=1 Tax=Brevibacillus massiliensis TaxID=1118054 RepID=UPI000553C045|nr:permease [Brevibacillus massiliensis]
MDKTVDFSSFQLAASPRLLDVKTLFLSILLEAIPFVLLGVFFSAFIQTFVRDEQVRCWTPKSPLIAIPFAALLGFLFPVCECAIVPIVRRLILKGMPVYVGIVYLLAGPVINPVVMAATYMAFPAQPDMVLYRSLIAALVAVSTGALVSAVLQVYFSREILTVVGQTPVYSHLAMMGLGFVFSLCSEADAFIAASFANTFSKSSLVAFMVFGPMIDFKNTLMLLGVFRFPFVAKLIAVVFTLVLAFTLFLPM